VPEAALRCLGCKLPARVRAGMARARRVVPQNERQSSRACLHCPCAEVLSESRVSRASDVYSFGMMMLELYTCKPLFPGLGHFQVRAASARSCFAAALPACLASALRTCQLSTCRVAWPAGYRAHFAGRHALALATGQRGPESVCRPERGTAARRNRLSCVARAQVLYMSVKRLRPDVPEDMPAGYRALMESCWAFEPAERPTFRDMLACLRDLQGRHCPRPSASSLGRNSSAEMHTGSGAGGGAPGAGVLPPKPPPGRQALMLAHSALAHMASGAAGGRAFMASDSASFAGGSAPAAGAYAGSAPFAMWAGGSAPSDGGAYAASDPGWLPMPQPFPSADAPSHAQRKAVSMDEGSASGAGVDHRQGAPAWLPTLQARSAAAARPAAGGDGAFGKACRPPTDRPPENYHRPGSFKSADAAPPFAALEIQPHR